MAAATQRVSMGIVPWGDDKIELTTQFASAATYYPGQMICRNSSGVAVDATDTAGLTFAGINAESDRIQVFSTDTAGRPMKVERPWRFSMNIASAAAGDEGKKVYIVDNQTVGYSSSNSILVGFVDQVLSGTVVLITPLYAPLNPVAVSNNTLSFSGSTGANSIVMPDNLASALVVEEGSNVYLQFVTTNGAEQSQLLGPGATGATNAGGSVAITGGIGGATSGLGGAVTIAGGAGTAGNAAGGAVSSTGGAGQGSAAGGASSIVGGVGGATGAGGAIAVTGGAGGATSGTGGAVAVAGGAGSAGNANGGAVTIDGGAKNGSGSDGVVTICGTHGTLTIGANTTISDAKNIILNATTGSKIGTATTQKLGFFNATPIVQPAANTDTSTGAAGSTTSVFLNTTFTGSGGTAAYTVGGVVTALKALGLLAA